MRELCASVAVPSYTPRVPTYQPYTRATWSGSRRCNRSSARCPSRNGGRRQRTAVPCQQLRGRGADRLAAAPRGSLLPAHVSGPRHAPRAPLRTAWPTALQRGGCLPRWRPSPGPFGSALNPHPARQLEQNVPVRDGEPMAGTQHKYPETVLFFPTQGQTCHAYCSFCFRWAQFIGDGNLRVREPRGIGAGRLSARASRSHRRASAPAAIRW